VEDNLFDAELTEHRIREEWPRCTVDRVDNRFDFLAAMKREKFDLILSDFSMPGFNGLEALELSQAGQTGIPFIFLSGTIGEQNALKAMESGAADYMIKDRPERLISAIRRALDRPRIESPRPPENDQAERRTILVIDDEDGVREIVATLLHAHGFQTRVAIDGASGLALYEKHHASIDAVITDMMMPGLSVFGLVEGLRATNPDVRIIATSGLPPDRWGLRFEPGRLQFLPKPMTGLDLFKALNEVLPARSN
jgi:CheY-like chemotaxis protein